MNDEDKLRELRVRAELAEVEVGELRHRLSEAPARVRVLEERLLESKGQLSQAMSQNEKLTFTLQQAKENIAALREEVDKLTQPPSAYGTFLTSNEDGSVDIYASNRKMRVAVHPGIDAAELRRGQEVVLNESLNVVVAREFERVGEVVTIAEILEDGNRALISGRGDEELVAEISATR
jgi:proteasome-associated ATPase